MERVLNILILLDIHLIVLDQDNCAFVAIGSAVVRCTENCDHRGESLRTTPSVHLIAVNLNLMSSNNREKVILFKYVFDRFQSKLN